MHICEWCENECNCGESADNCICSCQEQYETNITCEVCLHDLLYCTCSEEEKQKAINDMIKIIYNMLPEEDKAMVDKAFRVKND